jgi:hypothetical protein
MFLSIEPASARSGAIDPRWWWHALDGGGAALLDRCLSAPQHARDEDRERRLLCRACGHAIAREQDRISMQGAHEHHRANPHGIHFRIGCFRQASGGAEIGEATPEHSWFVGYRWKIMLCIGCGVHLGWGFHAGTGSTFYGLILDRLVPP